MNWYQPLEQRLSDWRQWRLQLSADVPAVLLEIQYFWYEAPLRKNSKLTDDFQSWPDAWQLLNNMTYCNLMRALGMFYTICLHSPLLEFNPELQIWYDDTGERLALVVLSSGKYILNFQSKELISCETMPNSYQHAGTYTAQDFKFLL